jgi:formate dehydrogenase beta subunit
MKQLTRGAFALPGTSFDFKTGSWRNEKPFHKYWGAPCHVACPAGEDAQAYIGKLQEGKPKEAWEILVSVNPLPAVTARVCPHFCEQACNRQKMDEPIAIHLIERHLGDEAIKNKWAYPVDAKKKGGDPVAVVGAGPSGLSASYHLRRLGYQVTLIDALPLPGGLLRTAIPVTRLPRDVLDAEVGRLLALGIDFKPRTMLGRDIRLEDLLEDYRYVFMGTGASKSREWSVDGAVPPNLQEGLGLLKEWLVHGNIPRPKSVAIHGGGNTAVDLARVMKRAGVKDVHVITASGLPGAGTDPKDVLNVVPREYEQAVEEGIVFHPFRTIQRLLMRGSKLVGLEMVRLKKLPQASGRTARVSFEGTETVLHVEMVVPAIGEVVDSSGYESLVGQADYFKADPIGRIKTHDRVLVGGDARGDRGTVTAAIGDGRIAASAIHALISGEELPSVKRREFIPFEKLNVNYFELSPRAEEPMLPVEARTDTDEIEGALTHVQISEETKRCFSCGNCMACDNCWTLCPDNAVIKTVDKASDGSHYVFDYEFCKGCGVCAKECPCGYIGMAADD